MIRINAHKLNTNLLGAQTPSILGRPPSQLVIKPAIHNVFLRRSQGHDGFKHAIPPIRSLFGGSGIGKIVENIIPTIPTTDTVELQATVVFRRKNLLDIADPVAQVTDGIASLLGQSIQFQLVSVDKDKATGVGKRSDEAQLDGLPDISLLADDEGESHTITFKVAKDFGTPGAVLVDNNLPNVFFLKHIIVHTATSDVAFPCNSWVHNRIVYNSKSRIFFSNEVCLPSQTPEGLVDLRASEMEQLRGNGTGERVETDRIYDYDVYNDLGNPDLGVSRPILGGSQDLPYPRRCRTGRAMTITDAKSERPTLLVEDVYVPRDEIFDHIKESDFLGSSIKSVVHAILPAITILFGGEEFKSFQEVKELYATGISLPFDTLIAQFTDQLQSAGFQNPLELINALTDDDSGSSNVLRYPTPQIIQDNDSAWSNDDEFARQSLAGLNPVMIERITQFPLVSKLDPNVYGSTTSSITKDHLEKNMEGLTVTEAMAQNKLYMLDYHDWFIPYLRSLNELDRKGYATRSVFFLSSNGKLKLLAIELSLPSKESQVFTPTTDNSLQWQLAKAHVGMNDATYHQLVSHWLRTHACIEPFIIATRRQLSALHPLNVLMVPHFKNTMNINALARKVLVQADGLIETNFSSGPYSIEMSSIAYKNWRFDEQSHPADLIKRGVAIKDPSTKSGVRLLIEDYPFAVDGLEIWQCIMDWVKDYIANFYKDGAAVQGDVELQQWWKEVTQVGHGDKKEGWVEMKTVDELAEVMGSIIWIASAHHAAVNFGQYAYAGFMPNKPTIGRDFISEGDDATSNSETSFLQVVSNKIQTLSVITILEVLSMHASDEEYLGQRTSSPYWSSNEKVLSAFKKFSDSLSQVEANISKRNEDSSLINRKGTANVPYTLLFPSSPEGLTGRGVPNSTSI